ncbi:hypothetical protein [uncultured Roseibium sp.]|uniref:hypothetical protein n=1 Tax=uncultured Roseibium sp. TaxID=1936171 RepID=UPI0026084CF2|nr:hypothetical protein [uncultured Roseibium sp.]
MSFVRQYRRFLRVRFEDDGGDAVDAFDVRPTTHTRRVMADHSLAFRPGTAGFSIYSRNNPDAADPLIGPISDRTRLSFGLRITDPQFYDRYHPDLTPARRQILLENLGSTGAIQASGALSAIATVGQSELVQSGPASDFPVAIDLTAGSPDRLHVRDRFDNTLLAEQRFTAPPGTVFRLGADLSSLQHPAVRLTTPVAGALDQIVYADDEISSSGAGMILDLWWEQRQDAVPSPNGALFTASFRARTS